MSERIDKLNSLVQQEVAAIILREVEFPTDCLVTVTRASVADDAESAKVWVSVLPAESGKTVMKILEHRIADIQDILNKRLVMKFVPRLKFELDTQNIKAEHVTKILDELAAEGDE